MSVASVLPSSEPAKRRPTAELLLEAAARVFARDGINGATTREIARTAGVNEVTLFRHFQTKENLVSAVAERMCGAVSGELRAGVSREGALMDWNQSFTGVAAILARFGRIYFELMFENLPLILTFIGEIHRHQSREEEVLRSIFFSHRKQLLDELHTAQESGAVRRDANLTLASDQLGAMIFSYVIKRRRCVPMDYSPAEYFASAVRMAAASIEIPAAGPALAHVEKPADARANEHADDCAPAVASSKTESASAHARKRRSKAKPNQNRRPDSAA